MTYDEVVKHFGGTAYKVALALKMSTSTPYNWHRMGYIPIESQQLIEKHTKGKLKASLEHLGDTDVEHY